MCWNFSLRFVGTRKRLHRLPLGENVCRFHTFHWSWHGGQKSTTSVLFPMVDSIGSMKSGFELGLHESLGRGVGFLFEELCWIPSQKQARKPTCDALQKEVLASTWTCFTDANFSVWWWRTLSLVGLATLTISVMSPSLDRANSKLHSCLRNKIGALRTHFSFPELVKLEHSYPFEETVSFQSAGKETFPETNILCLHCCVFPWSWENGKNDWLPCGHLCWISVMVCSLENKQTKPRDE